MTTSGNNNGGGDSAQVVALKLALQAFQIGASLYLSYYFVNKLVMALKTHGDTTDVQNLKKLLAKRLRRPEIEAMELTSHEARVSVNCISPEDIEVTFADIGGMEEQLDMVRDNIILPMQMARMHEFKTVLSCPTGALLYGRPGTGKTMTAKALAKEANATFLDIKASTIMEKYLGESDKMAAAVFSLARKLSPTVIFIDEIDTLLRNRDAGGMENSGHSSMQGVLLSEWDGLAGIGKPVIVLGATNRPQDLDKAFLRRMPVMIKVDAPDLRARLDILKRMLSSEALSEDVMLEEVAMFAEGFTGSDLRELVRVATLQRAKQLVQSIKTQGAAQTQAATNSAKGVRPLLMDDFVVAMGKRKTSSSCANDYAAEVLLEAAVAKQGIAESAMRSFAESQKQKANEASESQSKK